MAISNFKLTQTGQQIQNDLNLVEGSGGTTGQVLTKTESGVAWQDGGGSGMPAIDLTGRTPTPEGEISITDDEYDTIRLESIPQIKLISGDWSAVLGAYLTSGGRSVVTFANRSDGSIFGEAITANGAPGAYYIQVYEKELKAVTGTNDGTNWTTLKIGNITKNIPSGGSSYTAGNGINISNNTISADTAVLATKTDISTKQDKLTAGNGINITDNTISADTTVLATKTDIPVGEIDVVFNGTATTTTATLTNIVVGNTTYLPGDNHITAEDFVIG